MSGITLEIHSDELADIRAHLVQKSIGNVSELHLFTAAEMARCLATSPQNVRQLLRGIPAVGWKWVRGVKTCAWSFGSLPSPLIARLAKLAIRYGFATPLEFLQNGPRAERLLSIAEVGAADIARAQKLHRVLAPCLRSPAKTSIAELARIAAPDYSRELGKVSDRQLRTIITRTIERDRGARNFDRITLYLPDRPSKAEKAVSFGGVLSIRRT